MTQPPAPACSLHMTHPLHLPAHDSPACLSAACCHTCEQVTTGSDVYSFGVLMWYLYMGMQPYMLKDGVLMRNTIFPHFPRSAQPEYRSLAESCLQRDPHMRPSFVEISSSLSK